jgi:hypothetical protein
MAEHVNLDLIAGSDLHEGNRRCRRRRKGNISREHQRGADAGNYRPDAFH